MGYKKGHGEDSGNEGKGATLCREGEEERRKIDLHREGGRSHREQDRQHSECSRPTRGSAGLMLGQQSLRFGYSSQSMLVTKKTQQRIFLVKFYS